MSLLPIEEVRRRERAPGVEVDFIDEARLSFASLAFPTAESIGELLHNPIEGLGSVILFPIGAVFEVAARIYSKVRR